MKALKSELKEIREKERNTGLFILALFFGLLFGITGNIIYDLFVRGNFSFQIFFLTLSGAFIIFLYKEMQIAEKRMKKMERKIKELEKGVKV